MMSDFVIEEVTDLDAVWDSLKGLFLELNEYHAPWVSRRLRPDWEARWREYVSLGPDRLVLMGKHDGEVVAYLNALVRRGVGIFDETAAVIDDAFVKADFRRHSIGGEMLHRCEEWALGRGATELRLNVHPSNDIGLGFWRKSGFDFMSHVMSKPPEASR